MEEIEQFNIGGLRVHWQPSKKFKTTTIVLQAKAPLEKETSAGRTLLAHVLQAGTNEYPSRRKIRHFLDDLYGASFAVDIGKKGEHHVMTFLMEVASENYLETDEPLLPKALQFLMSALHSPLQEEGAFSEDVIKEEKQALIRRINNIADDKIRYANIRLIEEMCEEEPYALHPFGSEKEVDDLSNKDLQQAYEDMRFHDRFDLFITGPASREEIEGVLQPFSSNFKEGKRIETTTSKKEARKDVNKVVENQQLQQAKLHLGFRIPYTVESDEYSAVLVTNGLFGGFPHSKLFVNVREKESLAYYAASRFEPYKGLIFAMAGIASEQYEKAVKIIRAQLDALKKGEFSDDELQTTKEMIRNQLLEQVDTARGTIELNYQNVLSGRARSLEDRLKEIASVDRDGVTAIANSIELDTIYLLTGEEAQAE